MDNLTMYLFEFPLIVALAMGGCYLWDRYFPEPEDEE